MKHTRSSKAVAEKLVRHFGAQAKRSGAMRAENLKAQRRFAELLQILIQIGDREFGKAKV